MTPSRPTLVVVVLFGIALRGAEAADLGAADATFVGHRERVVVSTAGDFNGDGTTS